MFRAVRSLLAASPWLRRLVFALAAFVLVPYALAPLYRWFWPVSTQMLWRMATFQKVERRWTPLSEVSPSMVVAVIASEDARFCLHSGVDFGALREVIEDAIEDGPSRGGSTITMQVARNLFLWQGRSYVRKALEIPLALWIDLVLPKRRILEIYLNVAEWDEGVFGVAAASRREFDRAARGIDGRRAALLATALPAPARRRAGQPSPGHARLATGLIERIGRQKLPLDCLSTPS